MKGSGVDLDLLQAFEADCYNGFGFQCSPERCCLYLGQPFIAKPITSDGYPNFVINEAKFLKDIHAKLSLGMEDIWMTYYLGRDFLTIHAKHYNDIPRIINACLECGYKFITHGEWKTQFIPGELFTRTSFELKLIETLENHAIEMRKFVPNMDYTSIYNMGMRPFLKHWNYATPQGREFCTRLRQRLRKQKERSAFKDRFTWPKYCETAKKYGVLHAGGWAQYDPGVYPPESESPLKKSSPQRVEEIGGEEVVCMICLDKPPSTLVLPCEHRVVCDDCSSKLDNTPDKKTCVQCRRVITDVFYSGGQHIKK